jgi:trigger factor
MKHTVEKITPSHVKLTVEVEQPLWKESQEKSFTKLSAKVSVPGFRPGKAPKEMLRERIPTDDIWNDAIEAILSPVFAQALTEEKLAPYFRPQVNITKVSPDELTIVYDVILVPSVKLGTYKGLAEKKEAPSVTDEEIKDAIDKLLKNQATLVLVDRPAQLGDTVDLDFDGYLPDEKGELKAFDGGKADNYSLELGSHSFIPGFEEAVVGLKAGDKKDIKVTFPKEYVKELAGKEATFKILVHEVKEKKVPELNEETIKNLHIKDVTTLEQLQDYEKKALLEEKVRAAEDRYYQGLVNQIVKASEVVVDEEIIKAQAAEYEDNLKKRVEQQGLTFEQYLEATGTKEEDLKAKLAAQAKDEIANFFVLHEIQVAEKLALTDEDVEKEIARMAETYKLKVEDVKGYLKDNMDNFRSNLQEKKIHDYIISVSK